MGSVVILQDVSTVEVTILPPPASVTCSCLRKKYKPSRSQIDYLIEKHDLKLKIQSSDLELPLPR